MYLKMLPVGLNVVAVSCVKLSVAISETDLVTPRLTSEKTATDDAADAKISDVRLTLSKALLYAESDVESIELSRLVAVLTITASVSVASFWATLVITDETGERVLVPIELESRGCVDDEASDAKLLVAADTTDDVDKAIETIELVSSDVVSDSNGMSDADIEPEKDDAILCTCFTTVDDV